MPDTFIDFIEDVAKEVSQWGVDYIDTVVNALAPDGRPFGMEELDEQEQVGNYLILRGDSGAWEQWIEQRALEFIQRLTDVGIAEDKIFATRPFDIAERFAIDYSTRMEAMLRDSNGG